MDYICLEYRNSCNFADILYQNAFKQRLFIDATLCRPTYEIEEEGYKDGEGNFISTFQRQWKIFNIEMLCTEQQTDAIFTIPLHDTIYVYLQNGEYDQVYDLEVKKEDLTAGISKVILNFRTRYLLKTNCCTSTASASKTYVVNHKSIEGIARYDSDYYVNPFDNGIGLRGRWIIYWRDGYHRIMYINVNAGREGQPTWLEEKSVYGDVVINSTNGLYYFYNGKKYLQCPSILTGTMYSPTIAIITGFAYPETFVEIQYKISTDVAWTTFATISNNEFNNNGKAITGLSSNTYNVRYRCYNHNYNYGYSNTYNLIVP